MRSAFCALALFASAAAIVAAPHASAEPPTASLVVVTPASLLEQYVQSELPKFGYPGVIAGVVVKDKLLLWRAWGVRDRNSWDKVTPSTVFRIASITKVISGAALLRLRDDGKLTLDDPLSQHLPEASSLLFTYRDSPPITLRHLVTHTSGLQRDLPPGAGQSEPDFLRTLRWIKVGERAGTHTAYSNFAMGLVGPVVRRVSGMPFRDFVSSRFLTPLGMTSTVWEAKDTDRKKLATGYLKKTPERTEWEASPSEWRMGAAESFGGLYTTLDDMSRFVAFELGAWDSAPDVEGTPLKRATLRESQTLALSGPPEPARYGVNWALADDVDYGSCVFHTGATDEYSASVMMFPRRSLGVIVLANTQAPGETEMLAKRILRKAASLDLK